MAGSAVNRSWCLPALFAFLLAACDSPTTVYGRLALVPGERGDVRLARVELHDTTDWDGPPVYTISPDSGGQFQRCSFLFPEVKPGAYYLLAWRDLDADGRVSNGDLTGVYGALHQNGSPGKPVIVPDGWTVDAADISMVRYVELLVVTSGRRGAGDTLVEFSYSFNNDVKLTALDVAFPGSDPLPDGLAPGMKKAGTVYYSRGWRLGLGEPVPAGLYRLTLSGLLDTMQFTRRAVVHVQ